MDDNPQAQAAELKRLAQAKFGTLSAAEQELLKKVPTGDVAYCNFGGDDDPNHADAWGQDRQIRAKLVAWLCTNEGAHKHVPARGIQVHGADITSLLDLRFEKIPFPLVFHHCRIQQEMNLTRAEVSELDLDGSTTKGMMVEGVVVKNGVFLGHGFISNGEVRLARAQIGSDLDCTAGSFVNEGGNAISADGVTVNRVVVLGGGFIAKGEVRLLGAQIGGDLNCGAGTFLNDGGRAISADGVSVNGNVFLGHGFTANGMVSTFGAQIGGELGCDGGVFSNTGGDSLSAERIFVKRSVRLSSGFKAYGRVRLISAQIGGDFDCTGGNFRDATLDLTDASSATLRDSGLNDPSGPESSWTLWPPGDKDHYLVLDGFTYGRIASPGRINVDNRLDWLGLQPQVPFHPQPYLQLAKVLEESGNFDGRLRVLEEMEARRGRYGDFLGWVLTRYIGYGYAPLRAFWWAAGLAVLGWIIYRRSYLAGGIVPTDKDACAKFREPGAPIPGHYPSFSPLVYSVENSLPLVKLGQGDKWQPDPERQGAPMRPRSAAEFGYRITWTWLTGKLQSGGQALLRGLVGIWGRMPKLLRNGWTRILDWVESLLVTVGLRPETDPRRSTSFRGRFLTSPRFVMWFLWFQILVGWLLATLFLAGVSGIVHK